LFLGEKNGYRTRIGLVRRWLLRIAHESTLRSSHLTHESNYAPKKYFYWLKLLFVKKNERKPENTCIIAVKCRRDCHLANQEGCLSLLKPCFLPETGFCYRFLSNLPKWKKNLYRPVYRFFFSGQNSDRFQDRPVKTGNRTCNRFLDRTECRGQLSSSKTVKRTSTSFVIFSAYSRIKASQRNFWCVRICESGMNATTRTRVSSATHRPKFASGASKKTAKSETRRNSTAPFSTNAIMGPVRRNEAFIIIKRSFYNN